MHLNNHLILPHSFSQPTFDSKEVASDSTHTSSASSFSTSLKHSNVPFPWKLHDLLDKAEQEGFNGIVSWVPPSPQGSIAFRVHDVNAFTETIMTRFFQQTKYKSFQRQLNMWGFERIAHGPSRGGYRHQYFVRGHAELCFHMKRIKVKGGTPGCNGRGLAPYTKTKKKSSVSATVSHPDLTTSLGDSRRASFISSGNHVFYQGVPDTPPTLSSNNITPIDGDCITFEGRSFFFVDDYNVSSSSTHEPPNGRQQRRRLSIEFKDQPSLRQQRPTLICGEDESFRASSAIATTTTTTASSSASTLKTLFAISPGCIFQYLP